MAKRGPRPFTPCSDRLMPMPLVAQRLGISVRTAYTDLNSAMAKLRGNPEFMAYLTEVR